MKTINWLNNKTVVITNVESKVARILLYKLITTYNCKVIALSNNGDLLKKLESIIKQNKNNLATYKLSKESKKDWDVFVESLKQNKIDIDVLINFADGTLEKIDLNNLNIKSVEKVFKTDFYSSMYAINTLMPLLKKSNTPAIINFSSLYSNNYPTSGSLKNSVCSAFQSYIQDLSQALGKTFYVAYFMYGDIQEDKIAYKSKLYKLFVNSVEKLTNKAIYAILKKKKRAVFGADAKFYDKIKRYFPSKSNGIIDKISKTFIRWKIWKNFI